MPDGGCGPFSPQISAACLPASPVPSKETRNADRTRRQTGAAAISPSAPLEAGKAPRTSTARTVLVRRLEERVRELGRGPGCTPPGHHPYTQLRRQVCYNLSVRLVKPPTRSVAALLGQRNRDRRFVCIQSDIGDSIRRRVSPSGATLDILQRRAADHSANIDSRFRTATVFPKER
jgi:hypothetical protein